MSTRLKAKSTPNGVLLAFTHTLRALRVKHPYTNISSHIANSPKICYNALTDINKGGAHDKRDPHT